MATHFGKFVLEWFDAVKVTSLEESIVRKPNFAAGMKRLGFENYEWVTAYPGAKHYKKDWSNLGAFLDPWKEYTDIEKITNRWDKVKHEWLQRDANDQHVGFYACAQTHREIILDAYNKGLKNILILEDDAIPTHAIDMHARTFLNTIETLDWDVITFGTGASRFNENTKAWRGKWEQHGLFNRLQKDTITQFHAYAVNSKYYENILEIATRKWKDPYDVAVSGQTVKHGGNLWAINPRFFIQAGGYSYMQRKKIGKGGQSEALFPDLLM